MQIKRVELTNIKPFAERAFEFADGVNVLCGPNGSGKSTVFEAIGYALFGVKASDFIGSADRFVRKGFKTGVVRVHFTAVDGLDYVVERAAGATSRWILAQSTADGPRAIEAKNADETEAELTRLLGLSDSRSLGSQFTTIIGPPQARFDGAFGVTGKTRADEFDRILGISAWTDANARALGVENEAKQRIGVGEARSASLLERTAHFDALVASLAATTELCNTLTIDVAASDAALGETAALVSALTAAEARAFERKSAVEAAQIAFALATERTVIARRDLARSVEAKAICRDSKDAFESHAAATESLAELEKKRQERDDLTNQNQVLRLEISKVDAEMTSAIANAETELTNLEADRAKEGAELEAAESELRQIAADRERLIDVERTVTRWVAALAGLPPPAVSIAAALRAVADVASTRSEVAALRAEVAGRVDVVERAAHYESSRERATTAASAVASIDAQLERFEHDRASLATGHCPILDEACRNLSDAVGAGASTNAFPAPLAARIASAESSRDHAVDAWRSAEAEVAENSKALQRLAVLDAAARRLAVSETELERRQIAATTSLDAVSDLKRQSAIADWFADAPDEVDVTTVAVAVAHVESVVRSGFEMSGLRDLAEANGVADDRSLDRAVAGLENAERDVAAAWLAVGDAASDVRSAVSHERLLLDERFKSATARIVTLQERLRTLEDRTGTRRRAQADAERQLADLDATRRRADEITSALAAFADLNDRLESERARLDASRDGYDRYRQHEPDAGRHVELEAQLGDASATLAEVTTTLNEVHTAAAAAAAEFDPAALAAAREREKHLAAERSGQRARLDAASAELARFAAERDELTRLRDERRAIERELALLRKTHLAIVAMRKHVMAAVPQRLGTRYREDASIRADRIYRRIAGSDEELRWGDGYQIQLVDMATNARGDLFERVLFDDQLSGGQKMTAVIALRLALLQMTRSSVGFFDEPTSNLDAERRTRLAEAFRDLSEGRDADIGGGRWYGQLFLISHDVAFTEITDHTTWLESPEQ